MFPSWIRSRNCSPRLVYFLAMETTRRRLASISSFLACSASASPRSITWSIRFRSVRPVSLETSISRSSVRRERSSLRASVAWSPFEVELRNLVENLERFLGLVFDLLFGEFFVVKLDDFLDRPCALAEILADRQQFLEDDGGARDGLEHQHLAALDAFGDGDFALARQQRYGAHLAQVHANRVVRLFEHPRGKVEVALLGDGKFVLGFDFRGFRCRRISGGAGRLRGGEVFVDIDTVALEGGEQVVNLLRRVDFSGQDVVYFVIEQVSALLAQGNELTYLVIFLFNSQRQEILPKSDACSNARGCAMQPQSPDHLPAESKDTKTQVSRFALKLRMKANR